MEAYNYCQSCGVPLDREDIFGTERDGSRSTKYCKYCYAEGAFIEPGMTLEQMKIRARTQLEQRQMPESVIQQVILTLPMLGRWLSGHPRNSGSRTQIL